MQNFPGMDMPRRGPPPQEWRGGGGGGGMGGGGFMNPRNRGGGFLGRGPRPMHPGGFDPMMPGPPGPGMPGGRHHLLLLYKE